MRNTRNKLVGIALVGAMALSGCGKAGPWVSVKHEGYDVNLGYEATRMIIVDTIGKRPNKEYRLVARDYCKDGSWNHILMEESKEGTGLGRFADSKVLNEIWNKYYPKR
jgi:hypothetical protein